MSKSNEWKQEAEEEHEHTSDFSRSGKFEGTGRTPCAPGPGMDGADGVAVVGLVANRISMFFERASSAFYVMNGRGGIEMRYRSWTREEVKVAYLEELSKHWRKNEGVLVIINEALVDDVDRSAPVNSPLYRARILSISAR